MIRGVEITAQLGAQNLQIFSESQLVVQQVQEEFETRDERMIRYAERVRNLISSFAHCELTQMLREKNQRADFLAKVGSSAIGGENRKIELILAGRNKAISEMMNAQLEDDLRTGIMRCLEGIKLNGKKDQTAVEARARYFFLERGVLFKFSFSIMPSDAWGRRKLLM